MKFDFDVATKLADELVIAIRELSTCYARVVGCAYNQSGDWKDAKQQEFYKSLNDMNVDMMESLNNINEYAKYLRAKAKELKG